MPIGRSGRCLFFARYPPFIRSFRALFHDFPLSLLFTFCKDSFLWDVRIKGSKTIYNNQLKDYYRCERSFNTCMTHLIHVWPSLGEAECIFDAQKVDHHKSQVCVSFTHLDRGSGVTTPRPTISSRKWKQATTLANGRKEKLAFSLGAYHYFAYLCSDEWRPA